jgi:hypothetical protein
VLAWNGWRRCDMAQSEPLMYRNNSIFYDEKLIYEKGISLYS